MEYIPFDFNGRDIFLSTFSPSQNVGLLIPIILSIILTREFSYGTIRNKVICGHKKENIYLSLLISSLVIGLSLFLISALINLLFGSLVLGYGKSFNGDEFLFILKSIGIGLLVYSTIIAFTVFIATLVRSLGFTLIIVIISTVILSMFSSLAAFQEDLTVFYDIVSMLPHFQLISIVEMDNNLVIKSIITTVIYLSLFTGLGILLLKKRDIK
jgi:ABC-type transport system involved in multi-copper enzyme maturation permease subunit